MIGGVTRHILPHPPGVPHLHVNRALILSRLHDRWGDPPHVTSLIWGLPPLCKQAFKMNITKCILFPLLAILSLKI